MRTFWRDERAVVSIEIALWASILAVPIVTAALAAGDMLSAFEAALESHKQILCAAIEPAAERPPACGGEP